MQGSNDPYTVLALDVGDARIGVARAHSIAMLPEPVAVIKGSATEKHAQLRACMQEFEPAVVVFGLPLLPDGKEGAQARAVRIFADEAAPYLPSTVVFVDESFSSSDADMFMRLHKYEGSNDAIAACIILERYFSEMNRV